MARPYLSRTLRTFVEDRAQRRCEYCLIDQEDSPFRHAVDHIRAVKHMGSTAEENLALACAQCNSAKAADLTGIDPLSDEIVRLFNPREQQWRDHFALEGAMIVGLTPVGRATVRLLRMNTVERVEERQRLQAKGRYPAP